MLEIAALGNLEQYLDRTTGFTDIYSWLGIAEILKLDHEVPDREQLQLLLGGAQQFPLPRLHPAGSGAHLCSVTLETWPHLALANSICDF